MFRGFRSRWNSRGIAVTGIAIAAALPALIYLGWTLDRLALYPALTSIADDSSNYLVMARHYSPWLPEAPAIRSVWHLQYFPPLYPMLLAITGAAHSILAAHALNLGLAAVGLAALAYFACRELGDRAGALMLALALPFFPGFLLGLQGILSEPLYLLLSVAVLIRCERSGQSLYAALLVGTLLGAAMLTRSSGMVLAVALLAQGSCAWIRGRGFPTAAGISVASAGLLYAGVTGLFGPGGRGEYAGVFASMLARTSEHGPGEALGFLGQQFTALLENWLSFFMIYWRDDRALAPLLLCGLLVLALAGTGIRLWRNRLDAWYVLGSLVLLVVWPFPGQMLRFLFPIVPLMLLHAVLALRLFWPRSPRLILVLYLGLAAIVLPAHAFLQGRLGLARESGLVPVYEWLRKPGLDAGRRELLLQNGMLRDLARLRASTGSADVIAAYEPSHVALLADRSAIRLALPPDFVAAREAGARFAWLTAIHPRMSREGVDGLAASGLPVEVWCAQSAPGGPRSSCLYRLHPP